MGVRVYASRLCYDVRVPMDGPELFVRHATASDAACLATLARRTFEDTFAHDNRPEDIALHVEQAFGAAQQRAEIINPDVRTLLAEIEGEAVAFAQLRRRPAPACVRAASPIELWRLYVDRPWIGRAVAQRLMAASCAEAAAIGATVVWLGVWERNPRAIAFYRKQGFEDVGTHVFKVGEDAQTDRVMQRSVC